MYGAAGKLLKSDTTQIPGIHRYDLTKFVTKDLDVCGVWAYPQIQFQTALDFLQITRAPLHELITHHLPLHQLEKGIDMLGQEGVYKVVIEPQS